MTQSVRRALAVLYLDYDRGAHPLIGAKILPLDREGPTCPAIVWVQNNVIYVLQHKRETPVTSAGIASTNEELSRFRSPEGPGGGSCGG